MGVMAEFKIREFRTGDTSKTQLIVHGRVAKSSKPHNVYTNKTYEKVFDAVVHMLSR